MSKTLSSDPDQGAGDRGLFIGLVVASYIITFASEPEPET